MKYLQLFMMVIGLLILVTRINAQTPTVNAQSFFSFTKGDLVNAKSVTNNSILQMLKREGYFLFDGIFFPQLPPERDVLQIENPTFRFMGDRYYSDPDDYYKGTGEVPPPKRFELELEKI